MLAWVVVRGMDRGDEKMVDLHLLEQAFTFWVVLALDCLLVMEPPFCACVLVVLEAVDVKGEVAFLAGDVSHGHEEWDHRPLVCDLST